jgi:hypothetical protein
LHNFLRIIIALKLIILLAKTSSTSGDDKILIQIMDKTMGNGIAWLDLKVDRSLLGAELAEKDMFNLFKYRGN